MIDGRLDGRAALDFKAEQMRQTGERERKEEWDRYIDGKEVGGGRDRGRKVAWNERSFKAFCALHVSFFKNRTMWSLATSLPACLHAVSFSLCLSLWECCVCFMFVHICHSVRDSLCVPLIFNELISTLCMGACVCVSAGVCFSYSASAPQLSSSSPTPLLLTMLPTCPACLLCIVTSTQVKRVAR